MFGGEETVKKRANWEGDETSVFKPVGQHVSSGRIRRNGMLEPMGREQDLRGGRTGGPRDPESCVI